jgi:hypothetical protein
MTTVNEAVRQRFRQAEARLARFCDSNHPTGRDSASFCDPNHCKRRRQDRGLWSQSRKGATFQRLGICNSGDFRFFQRVAPEGVVGFPKFHPFAFCNSPDFCSFRRFANASSPDFCSSRRFANCNSPDFCSPRRFANCNSPGAARSRHTPRHSAPGSMPPATPPRRDRTRPDRLQARAFADACVLLVNLLARGSPFSGCSVMPLTRVVRRLVTGPRTLQYDGADRHGQ